MIDNKISFFHGIIIAFILFILTGCGYKAKPFYGDKNQTSAVKNQDLNKFNKINL